MFSRKVKFKKNCLLCGVPCVRLYILVTSATFTRTGTVGSFDQKSSPGSLSAC